MLVQPLQGTRIAAAIVGRGHGAVVLILVLALTGCSVTLVAPYDLLSDTMATVLYGKVDALLDALNTDPMPPYADAVSVYRDFHADLRVLRNRNAARAHNEITVRQLDELAGLLAALEAQHRQGRLLPVMLGPVREIVAQAFRALLTGELEKKRVTR